MASSFNAFGGSSKVYGGHTPIWLGTVAPVVRGGKFADEYIVKGALYPAGTPVNLANGIIKPLVAMEVVSVAASTHAVTVKKDASGVLPNANDILSIVGATFTTASAAAKVSSVVDNGETAVITFASSQFDTISVGSVITFSAASSAASSGAVIADAPNGYLYNDVYMGDIENDEYAGATGAVVDFHGEGILIDRTPAAAMAAAMKVAVPNVMQRNG